MKNKSKLQILLTSAFLTTSLQSSAWAQVKTDDANADKVVNTNRNSNDVEVEQTQSDSVWKKFTSTLDNISLSLKVSIPSIDIGKGLSVDGFYKQESQSSASGRYYGIDTWQISSTAFLNALGIKILPKTLNLNTAKEVTIVSQYPDRHKATLRKPYNPLTRIPYDVSKFDEKDSQGELLIKEKDLISFSMPLSLGLGREASEAFSIKNALSGITNYTLTGDFNVQIFRINKDQVRVKINVSRDEARQTGLGINVLGLGAGGKWIVRKLTDFNFLSFLSTSNNTDSTVVDYIFNLRNPKARELYNEIIGTRLNYTKIQTFIENMKDSNPFGNVAETKENLIADLDKANQFAYDELSKSNLNDRGLIKVVVGNFYTDSSNLRGRVNIFRVIFRAEKNTTRSTSRISILKDQIYDANQKQAHREYDNYILDNLTFKSSESRYLKTVGIDSEFSIDGLYSMKKDGTVDQIIGFRLYKELLLKTASPEEVDNIKRRIFETLPAFLRARLKLDDIRFSTEKHFEQVLLKTEIFIKPSYFKMGGKNTRDRIANIMNYILRTSKNIDSHPKDVTMSNLTNPEEYEVIPAAKDYLKGDYLAAFAHELGFFPDAMDQILSPNVDGQTKRQLLISLSSETPLFNEVSQSLLLHSLPANQMQQAITAKVELTARDQRREPDFYPSKEEFNKENLVRYLINENRFTNRRDINFSDFFDSNGESRSIEDLVIHRTQNMSSQIKQ